MTSGKLHVTCVTHTAMSSLGCSLVEAHLQVEFSLVSAQLRFSERSLVLVSHFGSESGSGELWVLLGESGQSIEAQSHLHNIATFE